MPVDVEYLKSLGIDDEKIASISGHVDDGEKGLIAKRDELLGKVTKYGEEIKRFDGVDPDKYRDYEKQINEYKTKNMSAEERIDAERKRIAAEFTQQLESERQAREQAESKLSEVEKANIKSAEDASVLAAVGDTGAGGLILDVIRMRGLVETVEGKLTVKTLDKSKEHKNIDALLCEMKASSEFARLFNSSGLSGGGAKGGRSTGDKGGDNQLFGAARMRAARLA